MPPFQELLWVAPLFAAGNNIKDGRARHGGIVATTILAPKHTSVGDLSPLVSD